jgi:hypothetical protein
MPSIKHILFSVDFSQQSCGIAPYVACMASWYGARVTMLHAMDMSVPPYPGWPAYGPMVDVPIADDMREQWEQARQAMVEDANPEERVPEYRHHAPGAPRSFGRGDC